MPASALEHRLYFHEFKRGGVAGNQVGLWPVKATAAAYEKIIGDVQFWRSFGISVLRVLIALVLNLLLIILMAYPLSKSKSEFRARNIYMYLLVFAVFCPAV